MFAKATGVILIQRTSSNDMKGVSKAQIQTSTKSKQAPPTYMTTMKFHNQFPEVEKPLAAARMGKGVISAGYSQAMPSQPMAKPTGDKMFEGVRYRSTLALIQISPIA